MLKLEVGRMQCLSAKAQQRVGDLEIPTVAGWGTFAVDRVPHQRVAEVRHMHTNLMCAPGVQRHANEGTREKTLQNSVVGGCRSAR